MENLNTITMSGDYHISHKCLWTEAFGNAPELRVIRQKYIGANRLIHALQPRHGITFAPTLTNIEFKVINFDSGECRGEDTHPHEDGYSQCPHHALASRVEAGFMFRDCSSMTAMLWGMT